MNLSKLQVGIAILIVLVMFAGISGCTTAANHNNSVDDNPNASIPQSGATGTVAQTNCTPVTITQTDGTQVTLPCHPQRIVVAGANPAEMMIALGAQDKIVGVTQSVMNVSYIQQKIPQAENVGDWQIPNVERILELHPDIVIAYSSSKPKNIDQLTAANITVIYLDCFRLSTLASDARAIGALTGRSNDAEVYARTVEDTVAEVSGRIKQISPDKYPSVYYESYSDFSVSGPGSGADEMLVLAGGKNIASNISTSSAQVNTEWVVARQPDYIFKVISSTNTESFPDLLKNLEDRKGWDTIPAVKNDRVYLFANDIQLGPRAYIGLVYTAQILHPDEFRDLHPRQMLDDYAANYVPGTNKTIMVYP